MKRRFAVAVAILAVLATGCTGSEEASTERFCELLLSRADLVPAMVLLDFELDAAGEQIAEARARAEQDPRVASVDALTAEKVRAETEAAFADLPEVLALIPQSGAQLRLHPVEAERIDALNAGDLPALSDEYGDLPGVRRAISGVPGQAISLAETLIFVGRVGLPPREPGNVDVLLSTSAERRQRPTTKRDNTERCSSTGGRIRLG